MDRKEPDLKKLQMDMTVIAKFKIFTWVKNKKFRFFSCSENLSELAWADSPANMIGNDDFPLVWKNDAEYFRNKRLTNYKKSNSAYKCYRNDQCCYREGSSPATNINN